MNGIDLYQSILSGAVLLSAVVGMLMMFKKKVPMYFSLHVCGVWCYAIGLLYVLLMIICGETYIETKSLDPLAAGGMFTFFTSANYGAFNSLIDDKGKKNTLIRLISLFAALLMVAVTVLELVYTEGLTAANIILFSIEKLPIPFCVYFCVKFLLMKSNGDRILIGVKPLNLCTLLICLGLQLYDFFMILGNDTAMNITFLIYAVCIIAEVFLADWGRKRWLS